MIKSMCLALLLALAGCATRETPTDTASAGHLIAEEDALLAVMDAYMREISANDLAAMDARQTAEWMTYRFSPRPDVGWYVVAGTNAYWVVHERADGHTYRERYWSPTVLIRGGMALVWAPYQFWIDGRTSHCGVDAMSFAKIDGVWKVSNAMWTVEPNACAELRPLDPSEIRPPG